VQTKNNAFSLIEAAIVLAIISLVIGGIWAAAASVKSNYRVKEAVELALLLQVKGQQKLTAADYPQYSNGFWALLPVLRGAGIVPADYVYDAAAGSVTTPGGIVVNAFGVCYGSPGTTQCPMMNILITGQESGRGAFTARECIRALRLMAALLKSNQSFLYVDVYPLSGAKTTYTPPLNGSTMTCPAGLSNIQIYFKA